MTPRSKRRLSAVLFATLLSFTLVALAVLALVLGVFFFAATEGHAERALETQMEDAVQRLDPLDDAQRVALLEAQIAGPVRTTLLDADGTVIFDSSGQASPGEDHADRPEVREALERGTSQASRYSQTLHSDTLYLARTLQDGQVLRISETRSSLFSLIAPLVGPLLLMMVIIIGCIALAARVLTRRIMRPLDALDASEPLAGRPYAEMLPVLQRIGDQQRQLREQNAQLHRAEAMRRDFSANVSHEMKTPLQVISGYAELLAAGEVPPDRAREFAGLIHKEADSMRGLIDDVLVLSRLDEPLQNEDAFRPVDLFAAAKSVVSHLEPVASSQEVSLHLEGSHVMMSAHPALVDQLIGNLVSNAIRYNRPGGRVDVAVRAEGEDAVISVTDTGIGIPAADLEKIFERFYRVDKSRSRDKGGTGLGLAIAKHAALQHGGSIQVGSEEGVGTTFTVHLPLRVTS